MKNGLRVAARKSPKRAGTRGKAPEYVLRLYVSGATAKSALAITRTRAVCDSYLHGRYTLEVVDIFQQPKLARGARIVLAPTLVRLSPEPVARCVGTLARIEAIFLGSDLQAFAERTRE